MTRHSTHEVTLLLREWCRGDRSALGRLVPLVHDELHRLAHRYMSRERPGHSLQTTALVNEAYLRLIDASRVDWRDRAHFFAISANVMRRILVEFARSRASRKRGGNEPRLTLDECADLPLEQDADLVALDDALNALAELDPREARVVELRFFGGLTESEASGVLRVSEKTVRRDWNHAKVWLLEEMERGAKR